MLTKDYSLPSGGIQNHQKQPLTDDNQYSNLNLNQYQNQNNQSSNLDTVCSKSVATDKRKVSNYDFFEKNDLQTKKDSQNNFVKESPSNALNLANYESKKEGLKKERNNSSNGNTLSLHILAHENLIEASNDENGGVKSESESLRIKEVKIAKLFDSQKIIQKPFEFPRQKESDDENTKPEVAQFKASQRLLNPNTSSAKLPTMRSFASVSVPPKLVVPKMPKGEPIEGESEANIATNGFKLQYNNQDICKYDIEFTKTMIIESLEDIEMPLFEINNERMSDVIKFQKQKLYRSLMDEFIKSFPGLFLDGVFCFDGFATLYSIVPVGFSPKTRKLSRIKSETIMKEKCQILLHIKPSAGHSFNLKDDIDEGKQFLKALILNSALQDPEKLPYYDNQKIYCFNNAQINFSGFPSLGKVQKLHYGIVPEIVFAEDFTVVAFDTIKDIFYKPINLYKLCCGYFTFEKTVTLPLQMYDILEEFLNGMICLPNFGENKNIPIILCGHNSSRADEVLMMHENLVISLTRYYKIIYEYDIKQRYWPLAVSVINGKRSYFPLECLTVAPGQKAEISNLAPEKLKLFEEFTNITNSQKFEEIENVPPIFKLSNDPFCKKLKLSMEESPIHLKAKLLPSPKLSYGNQKIVPDSTGNWKISSIVTKYFDPCVCEKWKAVLLDSSYSIDFNNFTEFVDYYQHYATYHGIEMKLGPYGNYPAIEIPATEEDIYEMFKSAKENSVKFILIGLTDGDLATYSFVKCCERRFRIVTQCVRVSHIIETISHLSPVIDEIIARSNVKLGGLCYNLPLAKFQFDKNAVFIGIHVDMPSKISDDDKTSKYATIGLSLNNSGGSFLKQSGNFFVQSLEHDQIETVIEEIIKEVLNRFEKNFRPTRIIVYRSGSGSEDEIQNLLMKEVSVIRRAVSHFHLDIPVTFITSTKANYLQFFNANEDSKSPQGELRSGMVIDSSITHPKIDEFYLQASVNSESNFEPTKFSIVYTDEKNASMSLFEAWTFGLCWNSQNNCSSLNVPSILSSAQKYSQFGRVFLKSFFDQGESFNFEESYKARNSKLNYSKIQTLLNKNLVA